MRPGANAEWSSVDRATFERFRQELPFPVAISYKRIGACSAPDATRLKYILMTAEMLARLLGVIALAELRGGAGPLPPRPDLAEAFMRPSFGTWLNVLEHVALHGNNCIPELRSFVVGPDGKRTPAFRGLLELVALRNRFAHDRVPPVEYLEPRQIPAACTSGIANLERALGAAEFLSHYALACVPRILVEKRRDRDPAYRKEMLFLLGCNDTFDTTVETSASLPESSEVLVFAPEGAWYLNLDPLILFTDRGVHESDERPTEIADLFVYEGRSKNRVDYLACHRGGKLTTTQLLEPEPVRDALDALVLALEKGGRP